MTAAGSIGLAEIDDQIIVRFTGDVRLSLCTTLDDLIDRLLEPSAAGDVIIDLVTATNIDSTCLGLIAKLGIQVQAQFDRTPVLICPPGDVLSQISGLGLMDLFQYSDQTVPVSTSVEPIQTIGCEGADVKPIVLKAHQVLMNLNHDNQALFKDLVKALDGAD